MEIHGKHFVITGGSTGIGEATAKLLLQQGGIVTVLGQHKPTYPCTFIETDIGQVDAIQKSFAKIESIDGIICNAGIAQVVGLKDITKEHINSHIDINLKGVIRTCKYGAEKMVQGGNIIIMSSIAGLGSTSASIYGATKAAVLSLTKSYAVELAPQNIRVNAICPGIVDPKNRDAAIQAYIDAQNLIKRPGTSEEIAKTVAFLIDNEYMTGSIVVVDGGAHKSL